ncbi:hypothetical protein GHK92_04695 [Nocardioides sp. dk4132]|uniref:hypothetical protein n=1 Tax=unclassified Nocardioides TaxID=2615069 RepID=UPI001295BE05|nr:MULTISPECIES: hypothetical protein [unclassified Nocardioides]MQW75163.1 hypothetical protein [Nocardioides sp. dk4132]QGA07676.1 hypothetical protein GFH29_09910 [Nocardioides sp. dk884]
MPPPPTDRPSPPDEVVRGQMRLTSFRRVSHGLYLRKTDGLDDEAEFLRELRAWCQVLPPGAVYTHLTAARLRGWQLPAVPAQVPVFAAVHGAERRPRRPGLICSRLVEPATAAAPVEIRHGLPVDAAEEILLRAARDLGVLDLVIMIDSALAAGDLDPERMLGILASGRPGVRMARRAYELATALCDSAGETVLRLFHQQMDVMVEPQVDLYDAAGTFIGRADLLVPAIGAVHEYDGAVHREPSQHRSDLRRERGWSGTGYQRRGFVLDDLLNHPLVVMHELDRALDRPHDVRRVERWRRLVANSLYDEQGRSRTLNRWRRAMGFNDWARTA